MFSIKESFWNTNKNNWKTKKKQAEALEVLKPAENMEEIKSVEGLFAKGMGINGVIKEINKIKKWEQKN